MVWDVGVDRRAVVDDDDDDGGLLVVEEGVQLLVRDGSTGCDQDGSGWMVSVGMLGSVRVVVVE